MSESLTQVGTGLLTQAVWERGKKAGKHKTSQCAAHYDGDSLQDAWFGGRLEGWTSGRTVSDLHESTKGIITHEVLDRCYTYKERHKVCNNTDLNRTQ